MSLPALSFAMLVPGVFRLGHLRISIYGLFAAVALVAALALSQRTARLAGVAPELLWDAGLFALGAAFVLSRLLLIAMSPSAFVHYPLLMLSLPSLTYTGIGLTLLVTLVYLRRKRLPLLRTLDAWAPCAAVLAAVLALAHFVEGTDAGMPTTLPWGVVTPGDTILGRTHPVQLYAMVAALVLLALALRQLWRHALPGVTAATVLILGGVAAFLLDMLAQPLESRGDAWLDPGQYVALAAMIAGAAIVAWAMPVDVRERA